MLGVWRWVVGLVVAVLMAVLPARANDGLWVRAESQNFVIYDTAGPSAARKWAEDLEGFHDVLRRFLRLSELQEAPKLPIYVMRSDGQFDLLRPDRSEGLRGYYSASEDASYAVVYAPGLEVRRAGNRSSGANRPRAAVNMLVDPRVVLFHEYTHHFISQHVPGVYPTWFNEGFAEYISTVDLSRDPVVIGRYDVNRASNLLEEGPIDLTQLLTWSYAAARPPVDGETTNRLYATSWLLTHYLLHTPSRVNGLYAYLDAVAEGADPLEAVPDTIGVSVLELEQEIAQYLRGRLQFLTLSAPPALAEAAVQLQRLPATADAMLILGVRAQSVSTPEQGAALLADLDSRRLAGDQTPMTLRARLRAQLLSPDRRALEPLAAELIAREPDVAENHYLMGRVQLPNAIFGADRETLSPARRSFARAHRLDPLNPTVLYYYARVSPQAEEGTLNAALRAADLAPQVEEFAFYAATLLEAADRHAEARELLAPMANDPHNPRTAARARAQLERLRLPPAGTPGAQPSLDTPATAP